MLASSESWRSTAPSWKLRLQSRGCCYCSCGRVRPHANQLDVTPRNPLLGSCLSISDVSCLRSTFSRPKTCRNFAMISPGLYRFLAIAVLLGVKNAPHVGPLEWGRIGATLDLFGKMEGTNIG